MLEQINKRIDNVLSYIEKNPDSDPNVYEMIELTFEVAEQGANIKMSHSQDNDNGYNYAINNPELKQVRSKYFKMMEIRKEHLVDEKRNLGCTTESPLYKMIDELESNMITYNRLNTNDDKGREEKRMICKLGAVGLYSKQRKRDLSLSKEDEIIYDNKSEFEELKEYFKDGNPLEKEILQEIDSTYMQKIKEEKTKDTGFLGNLSDLVNKDDSDVVYKDVKQDQGKDIGVR